MKITEKHLKEFFPSDMRFTHYVARRYGYNFQNDWAVEKANSLAMEQVVKMYNEGREFENNEHLYGYVMKAFKFAIMTSFTKKKIDKLNLNFESQLTRGEGEETYNVYRETATADIREYDNTADVLEDILVKELSRFELCVFEMIYRRHLTVKQIANELFTDDKQVRNAKLRIQTKFKRIQKKIKDENNEQESQVDREWREKTAIKQANIEARRRLREQAQRKRAQEKALQRHRSSEAMSWLDLDA